MDGQSIYQPQITFFRGHILNIHQEHWVCREGGTMNKRIRAHCMCILSKNWMYFALFFTIIWEKLELEMVALKAVVTLFHFVYSADRLSLPICNCSTERKCFHTYEPNQQQQPKTYRPFIESDNRHFRSVVWKCFHYNFSFCCYC